MISNDLEVLINWHFPPLYYTALWSKDRSAVAALMSAAADPHLGNSPLTSKYVSAEMKDYIRSLSK